MRLAAIVPSLGVGGAERSLLKLLEIVAPLVSRIDVVCIADGAHELRAELPEFVTLHIVGSQSSASPRAWWQIIRLLRKVQPDVILGWSTYANFVAVVVSRSIPRARLVLSERNYVPRMFGRGNVPWLRRKIVLGLMRCLYPLADVVTANSADNIRFLRRYIGGKAEYRLLPNAIDPRTLAVKDDELPCDVRGISSPHILAVGRLDHQKGFDILLRAFALVRKRHPDWRLVVVGDGPEREALRSLSRSLGLDSAVCWLGTRSEPFGYYRWADLVVVPSRYEGFSNVLLEAMSSGKAVVCTDCRTGPRELTAGGRFGCLVPVDDPEALARAIVDLGNAPDRMQALGEAARQHVQNSFDVNAVRARYADALGLALPR
jgi:glycosyltransferase involved in cell wall biosynthesis